VAPRPPVVVTAKPTAKPTAAPTPAPLAASCAAGQACIAQHCDNAGWKQGVTPSNGLTIKVGQFKSDASYITVPAGWRAVLTASNGQTQNVDGTTFNFCSRAGFNDAVVSIAFSPLAATPAPTAAPRPPVVATAPPKVNCAVSGWSAWGSCSKSCGGGSQSRTRSITTPASNGGAACPALSEQQSCNNQACPTAAPTPAPGCAPGQACIAEHCDNAGWKQGVKLTNGLLLRAGSSYKSDASYITVPAGWRAVLVASNGQTQNVDGTTFNFCSRAGFNDAVVSITFTQLPACPAKQVLNDARKHCVDHFLAAMYDGKGNVHIGGAEPSGNLHTGRGDCRGVPQGWAKVLTVPTTNPNAKVTIEVTGSGDGATCSGKLEYTAGQTGQQVFKGCAWSGSGAQFPTVTTKVTYEPKC